MTVRAGQLRERFAFDARQVVGDDGYGNTLGGWAQVFSCAASVVPLRRGEAVQASRLSGVQPYVLTVRRSSASLQVTTAWRARDVRTGKVYNIRTVEPSSDKVSISMLVEEGVADG